jgi:hypothetical protein
MKSLKLTKFRPCVILRRPTSLTCEMYMKYDCSHIPPSRRLRDAYHVALPHITLLHNTDKGWGTLILPEIAVAQ